MRTLTKTAPGRPRLNQRLQSLFNRRIGPSYSLFKCNDTEAIAQVARMLVSTTAGRGNETIVTCKDAFSPRLLKMKQCTGTASMCIGCDDPCDTDDACEADYLSPCAPLTAACPNRINFLKMFKATFLPVSGDPLPKPLPPLSVNVTGSSASIAVLVRQADLKPLSFPNPDHLPSGHCRWLSDLWALSLSHRRHQPFALVRPECGDLRPESSPVIQRPPRVFYVLLLLSCQVVRRSGGVAI